MIPTRTLSVLLGALLASASAGIAFAQQSAPAGGRPALRQSIQDRMQARFNVADADHDGALSRDEVQKSLPHLASHFDDIDTNKDGKLSPDELKAAAGKMMHGHGPRGPRHMPSGSFGQADTNHDHVISRDEMQAYTQKMMQDFDAADANKDGQLTPDEMKAWHDEMRPARMPRPSTPTQAPAPAN